MRVWSLLEIACRKGGEGFILRFFWLELVGWSRYSSPAKTGFVGFGYGRIMAKTLIRFAGVTFLSDMYAC